MPWDLVDDVALLWVTGTGVSVEPARGTQLAMLAERGRGRGRAVDVLDLDWRPMFWPRRATRAAEYELMLEHVNVAVGNRAEVEVAVGTVGPATGCRAVARAWRRLAIVKMGGAGVLVATPEGMATVAPQRVEVVNGLGAGDAFGGALVHGLLGRLGPRRCARYANAAGAIVASRLACADAMPTLPELEAMLAPRVDEGVR